MALSKWGVAMLLFWSAVASVAEHRLWLAGSRNPSAVGVALWQRTLKRFKSNQTDLVKTS